MLDCLSPGGPVKLPPMLPDCEFARLALLRGDARDDPLLPRDCRRHAEAQRGRDRSKGDAPPEPSARV
jgi:hypothetical protein